MSSAQPARTDALSRPRILEAALAIVDGHGAEALTMRRLATALGISAPSLYWHFRSRDELLLAAAEHALAGVDVSIDDAPWPEQARRMLLSVWAGARRHPGMLDLVGRRPAYPEAGRRLMQALLIVLRRAGFTPRDAVGHTRSLIWTTFGFLRASDPVTLRTAGRDRGSAELRLDLDVLAPDEIPPVAECLPALASLDLDELFRRTLELVITGIEASAPAPLAP
jgi:AcrR family transcriptional regulator